MERIAHKTLMVEGAGRCPQEESVCAALSNQPGSEISTELQEHINHCRACADLYRRLSQFEQPAMPESNSELHEPLQRLDRWFQNYLADKQAQEQTSHVQPQEPPLPDPGALESAPTSAGWSWLFGRASWGFAAAGLAFLVLGGVYLHRSHFSWQQGTQVAEVKAVPSVPQPDRTGNQSNPPGATEQTGKAELPTALGPNSAKPPMTPTARGGPGGNSAERRLNPSGLSPNNSIAAPKTKPNLSTPVRPTIPATPVKTPESGDQPVTSATAGALNPPASSSESWTASAQAKPRIPAPQISAQSQAHPTASIGSFASASVSPNTRTSSGQAAKPAPPPIRIEAGTRVWIDVDSTKDLGDGNFQFGGVLLLPLESGGHVILEKGVAVAGIGTTAGGKTSLRVTEILRNNARYRIRESPERNTLGTTGWGSVVAFQGGKVAEVWIESEAVYQAVPGTSTAPQSEPGNGQPPADSGKP